jgi:hypothetical protein
MEDPEKTAARLAIHFLEAGRNSFWRRNFGMSSISRTRVESAADLIERSGRPLEPYITYVVRLIISHFDNTRSLAAPLPTEQQIVDWLTEQGGISAILLKYMALRDRVGGGN